MAKRKAATVKLDSKAGKRIQAETKRRRTVTVFSMDDDSGRENLQKPMGTNEFYWMCEKAATYLFENYLAAGNPEPKRREAVRWLRKSLRELGRSVDGYTVKNIPDGEFAFITCWFGGTQFRLSGIPTEHILRAIEGTDNKFGVEPAGPVKVIRQERRPPKPKVLAIDVSAAVFKQVTESPSLKLAVVS